MSSKDDPFGSGGRTVIRPSRSRARNPDPAIPARPGAAQPVPVQSPDATIFDPGISQHPPAGWASGTVIYQGAPVAENILATDASIDEPISSHDPASARKISQKTLLDADDSIQYSSANPIIAAAAPLLILFGQLRLMTVEKQAAPLAAHVAEAIEEFERKIAEAGVPEEDARIAKFVLCETADDIVGNLPGPDRDTWKQHTMLSHFFQVGHVGRRLLRGIEQDTGRTRSRTTICSN